MAQFVEVLPQEYLNVDGNTRTTKTYHGLDIEVNNQIIGRIESYKVSAQTRKVTPVKEVARRSAGRIVEQVPSTGNDTQTISVNKVELWNNEMELAFGYPIIFNDLTDQTRPFTLFERLYRGEELYRVWGFFGCWFSSMDRNEHSTEGDYIVKQTAEVTYTARVRIL